MKSILYPFVVSVVVIVAAFLLFENLETVFSDKLNALLQHPSEYALVSFGVLASDVVLPVPSSIIMYLNGYVLGLTLGSFLSLISLMISSIIGYYIGKISSGSDIKNSKAQLFLARYGAIAILISRGMPILAESVSIVCGYNRIPFSKYLIYNLLGYIPICILYAACGNIGFNHNLMLISLGCSVLIAIAFWFFGKSLFPKESTSDI